MHGVGYIVREILTDKNIAGIDPQYNLTTPTDVEKYKENLQPFVQAVVDVLQTGPNTVEELVQARINDIGKSLTVCFLKDKPWLRWLNFALLFPQTFEVSGNVVSLVGEGDDKEDTKAIDLNKVRKRVVLSHTDIACELRLSYARCYYTVQGKTYRNTHVVLLGASHNRFDMRKLIVGMRRATCGQYVHVVTCADEKRMLGLSKPTEAMQAAEPDNVMTGDRHCVDEEEGWDPSVYRTGLVEPYWASGPMRV